MNFYSENNSMKAIFFDIGHTLVKGSQPSARRLLAARLDLSEEETKRAGRLIMVHHSTEPVSLARALTHLIPERTFAEILRNLERIWEEQANNVHEVPGATSLLKSLKEKGFRLGVISNIWHPFYKGLCRSCQEMLDVLDFKMLSYQIGYKKPSLQLFQAALGDAGLPAKHCCMVGDSYEHDIAPALQLGMRTVWLLKHPEKEKKALAEMLRGERKRPHWVVESLQDAVSFLQKKEG